MTSFKSRVVAACPHKFSFTVITHLIMGDVREPFVNISLGSQRAFPSLLNFTSYFDQFIGRNFCMQ